MYLNDRTEQKVKQRDRKTNLQLLDIIRYRAIDNIFKLKTRKFKTSFAKYMEKNR